MVRFGGANAPATEIRFVQQVQDPDAEAHAEMGVAPDGVFIRAADGTEVDATQPVNGVIEIQQQSQGGSTFLLGHELAHNLLDVLRRTGTLTQEMDAALAGRFKGKDGAFDEEAFADAFGAELRDAFTLQEEERIAKAPKTKVGRILRGLADTVRGWAQAAFAFRRAQEDAQTAQANAPASVLEAFMRRQKKGYNEGETGEAYAEGSRFYPKEGREGLQRRDSASGDGETVGVFPKQDSSGNEEGGASGGESESGVSDIRTDGRRPRIDSEANAKIREAGAVGVQMQPGEQKPKYHVGGLSGTFPKNLSVFQWLSQKALDRKYLEAVRKGNDYEADKILLAEAARNGYTIPAFHGSDAFGFTVFSLEKMDDERSIFATNNLDTAKSYTHDGGLRPILRGMKNEYDRGNLSELLKKGAPRFKENEKWTYGISGELFDTEGEAEAALDASGLRKEKPMLAPYPLDGFDTNYRGRAYVAIDEDGLIFINGKEAFITENLGEDLSFLKDLLGDEFFVKNELMSPGVYNVALRMDNPLRVNAKGQWWNEVKDEQYDAQPRNTREWADYAVEHEHDGVIFSDIVDNSDDSGRTSDVYIVFSSNQVKSIDTKTYDDAGKLIPPSKRFNEDNPDIRFHIPNPTERFSETGEGKRVVAEVLDALIETNPAFVFDRERAVDAEANASEGSRERMDKARKRLDGIKAGLTAEQWQDVLGTAFEVSGRFDVLGETNGVITPVVRERMAGYLQDIVRNRATMLGRRAYMAGRNFAWRRAREEHGEVLRRLEEKRAKERKGLREDITRTEGDLKDIEREYRELETQAENQQRRVNYLSDVIDALNADKADLRERMREAVRAERVRQARKDAVRREVGVTSKQLKDVEQVKLAYPDTDIETAAGEMVKRATSRVGRLRILG